MNENKELYTGDLRYKDIMPEATIKKIREIFYQNDIFTVESHWFRDDKKFFSLGLSMVNIPIHSAGKGADEKYALASAYAEFIERLQNLLSLNDIFNCGRLEINEPRFSDGVFINYQSFLDRQTGILEHMIDFDNLQELASFFHRKPILCYPYYNVTTGKTEYLPDSLLKLVTGSNGMCAGNSCEEALIQGLCEIFERYVLKKVYQEKNISFPVIPEAFLKETPPWRYIEFLQKHHFEVQVRDCSLGGKLPVAGVMVRKDDWALFDLGASPEITIAIERCFTEMFQGLDFENINSKLQPVTSFTTTEKMERVFTTSEKNIKHQYFRTLRAGNGIVNPVIFDTSAGFDPHNLFYAPDLTSKSTLHDLLGLVKKFNHDVYIREVSFLGFPSFHVYIPGMSEVIRLSLDEFKLHVQDIPKARDTFFNLKTAGHDALLHLADTIKKLLDTPYLEKDSVLKAIHNLSLKDTAILNNVDPENFLAVLYYKTGDYTASYNTLKEYLKTKLTLDQFYNPPDFAGDHLCLLKILEYIKDGGELDEVPAKLDGQFASKTINEIVACLKDMSKLPDYFGIPECENCDQCRYQSQCNFPSIKLFAQRMQWRLNAFYGKQKRIRKYVN